MSEPVYDRDMRGLFALGSSRALRRRLMRWLGLLASMGCGVLVAEPPDRVQAEFDGGRLPAGWQVLDQRGETPAEAAWLDAEGQDETGALRLDGQQLHGPVIPLAIEPISPFAGMRAAREPAFYVVTVRLRAAGTPWQRHHRPDDGPPRQGTVAMRFYDAGSRAAPGSWFGRPLTADGWQSLTFTALAPQWTGSMRVVITAHPGCTLDVASVVYGRDPAAEAAFDRGDPVLAIQPEPDRWATLPRTLAALQAGQPWKTVVLGDSIANDLFNSGFHRRINTLYPGAGMTLIQSVHGSAGWHFFTDPDAPEDRVARFVMDHAPDLVVTAGMSNRDADDLRELVRRIRAGSHAEILAVSAAVCQAHYRDSLTPPEDGGRYPQSPRTPLRAAMAQVGRDDGFAVYDLGREWDAFLWTLPRPLEWYTRDTSHLNPRGMAVVARLMAGFFQPEDTTGSDAPVQRLLPTPPARTGHMPGAATGNDAPIPVFPARGRIVRVSPVVSADQIAPYTEAFRTVEYAIEHGNAFAVGQRIVVVQEILRDLEPQPAAAFRPGDRHRLELIRWEQVEGYETHPLSDALERFDAPLYFSRTVDTLD